MSPPSLSSSLLPSDSPMEEGELVDAMPESYQSEPLQKKNNETNVDTDEQDLLCHETFSSSFMAETSTPLNEFDSGITSASTQATLEGGSLSATATTNDRVRLMAQTTVEGSSPSATAAANDGVQLMAEKRLLFSKTMSSSDVSWLNRLVIPRKYCEEYFPPIKMKENGKYNYHTLNFIDMKEKTWEMKCVYWPKSQSYALTKGWKAYVEKHNLQSNDIVRFYEVDTSNCFAIAHFRPYSIRLFGKDIPVLTSNTNVGIDPTCRQNRRRKKPRKASQPQLDSNKREDQHPGLDNVKKEDQEQQHENKLS